MKVLNTLFIGFASVFLVSSTQMREMNSFALGVDKFGLEYVNSAKDGNYFISPLSISAAMAMTYAGAREKTAEEFEEVLHFKNEDGQFHEGYAQYQKQLSDNMSSVEWNLANRIWGFGSSAFEPEFLEINKTYYNAPIEFGASESVINGWVEKQTKGKIKDLLPPGVITVDTRLILTNAVYFKGDWKFAFKKKDTKKKEFYAPGGEVKVDMMSQKGGFAYSETPDYQAIRLPYKGNKQSMLVFLPKGDLKIVEEKIGLNDLSQLLRTHSANVNVQLPKFKMEYKEVFNNYLVDKGMEGSFGGGANFSGIMTEEPIWIDQVIHKAFIEVGEEGTEAAAATAVIMTTESIGPSKPRWIEFNANKPFLYFIVDDLTQSILFMGKLETPDKAK